MRTTFEIFNKYYVPADSEEDFVKKYCNHHTLESIAPSIEEGLKIKIADAKEDIEKYGITWLDSYGSTTGRTVSWYKKLFK